MMVEWPANAAKLHSLRQNYPRLADKGAEQMIRPIPVASNLAAVLKRIKAGDRLEEQAICGNVAIMLHCSAATDLLRRKMRQWADTKNKESPSYRRRSAVFPIHNLAMDMDNGTIWSA